MRAHLADAIHERRSHAEAGREGGDAAGLREALDLPGFAQPVARLPIQIRVALQLQELGRRGHSREQINGRRLDGRRFETVLAPFVVQIVALGRRRPQAERVDFHVGLAGGDDLQRSLTGSLHFRTARADRTSVWATKIRGKENNRNKFSQP